MNDLLQFLFIGLVAFSIPIVLLDYLTGSALRKVHSSIEIDKGVLADMPIPRAWGSWGPPLKWAKSNLSNLPTQSTYYAKQAIALARISDFLRVLMVCYFATAILIFW